jgi:hypothetical protein
MTPQICYGSQVPAKWVAQHVDVLSGAHQAGAVRGGGYSHARVHHNCATGAHEHRVAVHFGDVRVILRQTR